MSDEYENQLVIGIDVGGTDFKGAVIDRHGHVIVKERLNVPAAIGLDVRTACLAEGLLGAARGSEDYLFLTLGTGIGGAIVLHGMPYAGVHGISDFGHIVVKPGGPQCPCGRRGFVVLMHEKGV
jgi:predicted NBD/HSP70 family sugar kinase